MVVVQEMEREGQYAPRSLQLEVQRGSLAKCAQERVTRKCARTLVQKSLCKLERLAATVIIETKHEVGLNVRDVAQYLIDVRGDLLDLVEALPFSGLCFVAE